MRHSRVNDGLKQGKVQVPSRKIESLENREQLIIVVDRFPSLSETFIYEEIGAPSNMAIPSTLSVCVRKMNATSITGRHFLGR